MYCTTSCPSGGIGRRARLKLVFFGVPVRLRPRVPFRQKDLRYAWVFFVSGVFVPGYKFTSRYNTSQKRQTVGIHKRMTDIHNCVFGLYLKCT
jgi:hypothetical protein